MAPTESTRKVQGKRSANAVIKKTISMSDTIELFIARDRERERVCVCVFSGESAELVVGPAGMCCCVGHRRWSWTTYETLGGKVVDKGA